MRLYLATIVLAVSCLATPANAQLVLFSMNQYGITGPAVISSGSGTYRLSLLLYNFGSTPQSFTARIKDGDCCSADDNLGTTSTTVPAGPGFHEVELTFDLHCTAGWTFLLWGSPEHVAGPSGTTGEREAEIYLQIRDVPTVTAKKNVNSKTKLVACSGSLVDL